MKKILSILVLGLMIFPTVTLADNCSGKTYTECLALDEEGCVWVAPDGQNAFCAASGASGGTGTVEPPDSLCTEIKHDLSRYVQGCVKGADPSSVQDGQLCCLLDLMETISTYLFVVLLVLAGIIIILGAFQFVTQGSSPEKSKEARDKLIWALVGVAVAFAARGLVRLVEVLLT